jgi:NitT/TauT family transport system permease protein
LSPRWARSARRRTHKVALGLAFFVLFVLGWSVRRSALSGTFSPIADELREGWTLFARDSRRTSASRSGACSAAVLAAAWRPLGIAMGAYKPVEAFFQAFASRCALPARLGVHSAAVLWAGIGGSEAAVIFIGSFFGSC